jgi:hypothetical protein
MINKFFVQVRLLLILLLTSAATPLVICQASNDSIFKLIAPLPDALLNEDGTAVESAEDWESKRRNEVLELFRSDVYGRAPLSEPLVSYEVIFQDKQALGGKAVMKEVKVTVSKDKRQMNFTILIFLPTGTKGTVPLFLGLNFNGNHTIHPCKEISITDSWVKNKPEMGVNENKATEQSRGARASKWPVELILARGYGLATIYYGDIDPDFHDGFENGIHSILQENSAERTTDSWGSIAGWAWGLSRALDYFETDPAVDQNRVAVIGHSRLGKTSLWAGALDQRFALVVSNNSGCGGASLSRRPFGESLSTINRVFPHWFAEKFHEYSDNEIACPVDQHMLLSLIAPRPLYVASALEDEWADPYGEYLSLLNSGPVYGLYGEEKLKKKHSPEVNQPRWVGKQGYHIRSGKHDITTYDWEQYLAFADLHMGSKPNSKNNNPVSMEWIHKHIRSESPRLILTPELESSIREKIQSGDQTVKKGLQLLEQNAETMLELEPLAYQMEGRRLLGVSREAIRRITTLALVYRFERNESYLKRLEEELRAVCAFRDWNPSHFLDVGEMATAVALGLDWAGEWLTPDVTELAREALVNKALKPGIAASGTTFWKKVDHNWNLVCNGGLALAALTVFEDEPELASAILHQAVQTIPLALSPYAPDGIYPEGASYWFYATTYLTIAISGFETALGTDFGFTDYPGVKESAVFSQILAGPSGDYYNYFDAGEGGFQSLSHFGLLSWFSLGTGKGVNQDACMKLLKSELSDPRSASKERFLSVHFLNISQLDQAGGELFEWSETWFGGGDSPLAVFRDSDNSPDAFFLAAKGGMAGDNHGNMDAGSFIFEKEGVRWSVDPGSQGYFALEQIMGEDLWDRGQNSPRWSLLTKNNFGHSTLTVNEKMHLVDGRAYLIRTDLRSNTESCTFDMSPLFGEDIQKAYRTFSRSGERLIIRDELVPSKLTENISWQMITRAAVTVEENRIVLRQDGKELNLIIKSDLPYEVKVIDLSPPPLTYDKDISDLKRIEYRIGKEALGNPFTLDIEIMSSPQ